MSINRGQRVRVQTAGGQRVEMVALGGPTKGMDFEVVRVCTPDDWTAERGDEEAIPWPSKYVEGVNA